MRVGAATIPPHSLAQNGEVAAVVGHWGGDVLGLGRPVLAAARRDRR